MSEVDAKIKKALELKSEGNDYFAKGDVKNAFFKWHCAYLYLKPYESPLQMLGNTGQKNSPEQQQQINTLTTQVLLNLALLQSKENKNEKVIENCTKVIQIDPSSSKAYFRRGQAYLNMKDSERAETDLNKANELAPGDKNILAELRQLRKLKTEEDQKQKKAFQNMFSKTLTDDDK
eukprot:TRINITY_DN2876_c0_g1_i2.p1 TRINITY_DN2876_c0_g1~~TRINITY_DN2876_c0_g1_i2.p1  ORF type:complete len:177 (-),score=48.96 TRINITY_DN2876_c0_g1_i2:1284-1814(-)